MNKIKQIFSVVFILGAGLTRVGAIDFDDQGEYLGSSECYSCHERFYKLWSTSHHGKAMEAFSKKLTETLEPMTEPMMIGDEQYIVEFDEHGGVLKGVLADGTKTEHRIRHSFGGRNVRYFLIPMEKGKLQVMPLAYYVHQRRWYDATGSMTRDFNDGGPQDEAVHWTDRSLTFNTGCHDCHVSQLEKNYNPEDDSYSTTWKEPGINCETCHGPAEMHVKNAKAAEARGEKLKLEDMGLLRFHGDLNMEQRDATCGPCHAKGNMLTYDFTPGELYFDHYDLTSYEDRDFYPDGRDLGENYTWTAWMANPCYLKGQLECIHCHTSSGRFRFKENPNQSCMPCHEERVKNVEQHSHHPADSEGSQCIKCHMPTTAQAYMSRSDHTFRPPSPQASLEFGSPNACTICHHDKDAEWADVNHKKKDVEWAAKAVKKWHGEDSGDYILETGRLVKAARDGEWDKLPQMLTFLDHPKCDPAASVAILRLLQNCPDPAKWPRIRKALEDEHEWVRAAAASVMQYDESAAGLQGLLKACSDRFRTVRIRAAGSLLARSQSGWSEEQKAAFETAHKEYWQSLEIQPDRWATHYNQGLYWDRMGEPQKSLDAYDKAMTLRNDVVPPMINASMVHARMGNSTNAYELLKKAYVIEPESSMVNFNMALLEAEFQNLERAEKHLRMALKADDQMASAAYNLGVLLCQKKDPEGFKWLRRAAELLPQNASYLNSYIYFLMQENRAAEAESVLLKSIGSGQASAEVYFTLAEIYRRSGRIGDARNIYKKASVDMNLPYTARRQAMQMMRTVQ